MQPRTGTSGSGVSREEFVGGVARDINSKIPEPFDVQLLRKAIGVPSPTQVVLLQELERWNKVGRPIQPYPVSHAARSRCQM